MSAAAAMSRRWLARPVGALAGLAFALLLAEVAVRLAGFGPWYDQRVAREDPAVHEPDPVLGWQSKEGHFEIAPYAPAGTPIRMTFLDHGRRRTGLAESPPELPALVIVGGSFTQGWAISDEDTFAWKLQRRLPGLRVLNYAAAGYGSYQSLLMLERELPEAAPVRLVLYGFIEGHEERNVAPHYWLGNVMAMSNRGHVEVPFATLDRDGNLVRHPPARYLALPFRRQSAFVTLLERAYMKLRTLGRIEQKRAVTEKIILEMKSLAERHGAGFAVVVLHVDDPANFDYSGFFGEHGIVAVDCRREITEELEVPGEGHPNGVVNDFWASCIAEGLALDRLLDGATAVRGERAS